MTAVKTAVKIFKVATILLNIEIEDKDFFRTKVISLNKGLKIRLNLFEK